MTHVTCRLTAKNRSQLRNPTLGSRVWAIFTFLLVTRTRLHFSLASNEPQLSWAAGVPPAKSDRGHVATSAASDVTNSHLRDTNECPSPPPRLTVTYLANTTSARLGPIRETSHTQDSGFTIWISQTVYCYF